MTPTEQMVVDRLDRIEHKLDAHIQDGGGIQQRIAALEAKVLLFQWLLGAAIGLGGSSLTAVVITQLLI